jgi:hypothetical protein
MPEPCDQLVPCKDLDGTLLVRRAIYGPQLTFNPDQPSPLGVATRGAALRGVLDLEFEVRWRSTGLCRGPATSVMGLAPGEVVSVGLRTRSVRTFTSLVRDAAEVSRSSSHTEREAGPPATGGGAQLGGFIGGVVGAIAEQVGSIAEQVGDSPAGRFVDAVAGRLGKTVGEQATRVGQVRDVLRREKENDLELIPIFVSRFGSLFGDALGAAGAAVGGAVGAIAGIGDAAADAVSDLVDNVVGGVAGAGPAAGLLGTAQQIEEVVDTVERSESESHLRETSVTTTTESEQTVQRTFGNPYLDRSLELRFMPVYHRFEVSTVPKAVRPGLATLVADADPGQRPPAPAPGLGKPGAGPLGPGAIGAGARVRTALAASVTTGDEDAVRIPMVSLLQRATSVEDARRSVRIDHGLAWERTDARGNAVHVPLADVDVVQHAWGVRGRVAERLQNALGRLTPDALRRLFPPRNVRVVHVFAGVHVEAVPGTCVLPDIPAHLRVVVPGGTQYVPTERREA